MAGTKQISGPSAFEETSGPFGVLAVEDPCWGSLVCEPPNISEKSDVYVRVRVEGCSWEGKLSSQFQP